MIFNRPRTLLWQLGLALMALQAAAVVIVGLIGVSHVRRVAVEQTSLQLQRLTPVLAQRYHPLLLDDIQVAALQELVIADGRRTGTRITVIAPDGRVLADSQRLAEQMENHRGRDEIESALLRGSGEAVRHSVSTDEATTYFALRLEDAGEHLGVVRTALPLSAVVAESRRGVQMIVLAMAAALAITIAMIFVVSRRISGTISDMASGAARFAAGDLSHRIRSPQSGELAQLAHALNNMAAQLTAQIQQLRAQQSEQQAIHQSMSNGLIALDRRQHIISINRAAERLLGVTNEAGRGRLLQEVVREPELNRFISDALLSNGQMRGEVRLDRGEVAVEITSEPLYDANRQQVGLLVFINDITQLRRLESIRSDFAANVSHELRTPITNIQGYVETLLDIGASDQQQTRQFLEIIHRNSERLAAIIEDLLALAHLEQPDTKATLELEPASLAQIVQASIGHHESDANAKRMQIEVDVPDDLTVHVNVRLLEQAIGNLLSNAIKYSPAETRIRISGRRNATGETVIAVADEGPGISEQHLSRLFERFYRVDRARSRAMGGTGLGLAIVKHIALVHGGRVEVQSQLNKGSVFSIVLPPAPMPLHAG